MAARKGIFMTQDSKNDIKRYYIAYVDLLGYKDFFEKHPEKVHDFLDLIRGAIKDTKSQISITNESEILKNYAYIDVKVKIFSDNILLCMESGENELEIIRLLSFLSLVAGMQRVFITKYGLFLRGGVTIGDMFINDDFVFGQGLIDVVELEQKAIYPRIIVSEPVVKFVYEYHYLSNEILLRFSDILSRLQSKQEVSVEELMFIDNYKQSLNREYYAAMWKNKLLLSDADGMDFLNYLYNTNVRELVTQEQFDYMCDFLSKQFPRDFASLKNDGYDYSWTLNEHKNKLVEKLTEYGQYNDIATGKSKSAEIREKVLKKYMWVLRFHNYIVDTAKAPEYKIYAQANCDGRFMTMNVAIPQNNPLDNISGTVDKPGDNIINENQPI